jgi:hypothetical protein
MDIGQHDGIGDIHGTTSDRLFLLEKTIFFSITVNSQVILLINSEISPPRESPAAALALTATVSPAVTPPEGEAGQPTDEEDGGNDPQQMDHESEADEYEGQQQEYGDEASHRSLR